jgi:hypothetical protein
MKQGACVVCRPDSLESLWTNNGDFTNVASSAILYKCAFWFYLKVETYSA